MRTTLTILAVAVGLCGAAYARGYNPTIERNYEWHYPNEANGWRVTYEWTEWVASKLFEVGTKAKFKVIFFVENVKDVKPTPQEMLADGFEPVEVSPYGRIIID